MFGSSFPVRIVTSLTVVVLSLFTAAIASAQTAATAVDKPLAELTAPPAKPAAEVTAPANEAKAKPATETPKPEPDSVKPETATATTAAPTASASVPATTTAPVAAAPAAAPMATCTRTVKADIVAIPKALMLNRLGASIPNAFVFALRGDTIGTGNNIQLRPGKRPRPIVLRANVGDCLQIKFQNAIPPAAFDQFPPAPANPTSAKVGTQEISLHIQGQEWTVGPADDGSFVGTNSSSLASPTPAPTPGPMPGSSQTYTLFVRDEGTFLLYSMGDTTAQPTGQISRGLFGALNVQPTGAEWYRSQVTQQDLSLATKKGTGGQPLRTADGQPIIDYNAVYPAGSKYPDGTPIPPNTPILNMLVKLPDGTFNTIHSDLTAIITGPNAGRFPGSTGVNNPEPPCNAANNGSGATDPIFCANPSAPDRKQPYREFTIIYHEVGQIATQAFPVFYDPTMSQTVNAGFDGFAINYGTGGIGAEIYANRIGVGPMGGCVDCKFEEFFLSAWSVGDPAMLVDVPANSQAPLASLPPQPPVPQLAPPPPVCTADQLNNPTPNNGCAPQRTPPHATPSSLTALKKATKAYYPDDPSTDDHPYINDHTKFRIHHGGTVATHVHHQHAHQWLMSPNSDEGAYLDSQMISPGASYTLEMTFNGSGNRNKVVGDSIFHCHFYPHFAAGMWAMWRTHDTFEAGTELDSNGNPKPDSRALPDGEIMAGTPSPAIVPMPTLPMAPMPSPVFVKNGQVVFGTPINPDPTGANVTINPGFPYFIPGIAGMRAPHPPLDFAPDGSGGFMDGGLPRHVTTGGTIGYEKHDQLDWSKDFATLSANQLPEDGTHVEKVAMKFFGVRCRPSFMPDGTAGSCPSTPVTPPLMTQNVKPTGFILNGLPLGPQPGAPYADPAVDDDGKPINVDPVTHKQRLRLYKAAAIQLDVVLNKQRWHYPQQRILTLWNDVSRTFSFDVNTPGSGRPPEPLFFRGNSGDIIEYWHTNLVPNYYLVDDFQVRTPTDILGQHIHLVKFDVTSSDGAGNGFNYEDGTFSPDEVQEIIHALNASNGWKPCPGCGGPSGQLTPKPPPAEICNQQPTPAQCTSTWMGAQTTIQRWYLDPVVDSQNTDRTLRTVFTHDHFGPSTHQQAGLYAGLVVEPKDSVWKTLDGADMGGGNINTPPVRADGGPTSWQANILMPNVQDSYREFMLEYQDLQLAYLAGSKVTPNPAKDQGWRDPSHAINATTFSFNNQVMPRLVSTGNIPITGTMSVNYRNEPISFRIGTPMPGNPDPDLSYAFDNQAALKGNPNSPNPDPITPLMRAYQGDNVQVRVLVGAHVFAHQFNLMGPTWFAEPSWQNSGYRSNQPMGLSEHFELLFKVPSSSAPLPFGSSNTVRKCPDGTSTADCVDYLYSPSLDETGLAHGLWGIFRSYDPTATANGVKPLPNNPVGAGTNVSYATCPANAPQRVFNITAVTAQRAWSAVKSVPGNPNQGELIFNDRGPRSNWIGSLMGITYVRNEDLQNGKVQADTPMEPLILRANAGDCITVNLTNGLATSASDSNSLLVYQHNFNWPSPFNGPSGGMKPGYQKMSKFVGLHPQLLSYDAMSSFGWNIGWNSKERPDQFANFGETIKYQWYAGKIDRASNGTLTYTPVEFGAANLFPSDPMFQHPNGLIGQVIIEPQGSTWQCGDVGYLKPCDGPVTPTTRASASVTAGSVKFREFSVMISDALFTSDTTSAINYRSEPTVFRYGQTAARSSNTDFSCMTSNLLVDSTGTATVGDPETPIFTAAVGDQVRFRMTHPMGTGDSQVFTVHGHAWQRNPYQKNSLIIGNNNLSQWLGSRDNHGSSDHFELVIPQAGGKFGRQGDYLYTAYLADQAGLGAWGIFRVGKPGTPQPNGVCTQQQAPAAGPQPAVPDAQDLRKRFHRQPLNPGSTTP
jgi:hypothetical protein